MLLSFVKSTDNDNSAMSAKAASRESSPAEWADPGFFLQQSRMRNFLRLMRQLIKPPEGHKTLPTASGMVLILLALGIGSAAYNTSSNILFVTLSLLLSSLLLSGILSWINFKGLRWRLVLEPHFRAGEVTPVRIELNNTKKFLPTYSLLFNIRAVNCGESRRLYLQERLEAGAAKRLDWIFEPNKRGDETIELAGLESKFPFGFLRKIIGSSYSSEVTVWPRRITYTFRPTSGLHSHRQGSTVLKPGSGAELINLREYRSGDTMRQVYWKASARLRRLIVRETSDENQDAYLIFLETPGDIWPHSEQFETLCSFVGSLAEDLYMSDRLWGAAINDRPVQTIKRLSDLHALLAELARLEPIDHYMPIQEVMGATIITFKPGPNNQVFAYVGGNKAGSA